MSGNMNEYVFCPYCGGITPPGTCVNCGMSTTGQTQQEKPAEDNQSMPKVQLAKEDSMSRFQPGGGNGQNSAEVTGQPGGNVNAQSSYSTGNQYAGNNQNLYAGGNTNAYGSNNRNPYNGGNSNTYGGNNQNPYSGNTNQYGGRQQSYQQPKPQPEKKGRGWLVVVIVVGILLLLLLFLAIVAVLAAMLVPMFVASDVPSYPQTSVAVTQPSSDDYDYDDEEDYSYGDGEDYSYSDDELIVGMKPYGRLDLSDFDWDEYADDADIYSDTTNGDKDIFLATDYVSTFGSNHHNYSVEDFSGEYYEPFVDCIDTNQAYGLSRHYIEYSDVVDNMTVDAYIAYIQLEGNVVPNQDEINRKILELTANEFWGCLDGQNTYGMYYGSAAFIVDSFVTYNDSEKMSILLDINVMEGGYFTDSYIYAINIDLVNGEIMDNGSILNIDEDFAAMFREKCCAQNGTDIVGLNNLSDDEVAEYLVHDRSGVIFYTPYGMEIGYCYEVIDSSRGWMTITLSDYEQYLN